MWEKDGFWLRLIIFFGEKNETNCDNMQWMVCKIDLKSLTSISLENIKTMNLYIGSTTSIWGRKTYWAAIKKLHQKDE